MSILDYRIGPANKTLQAMQASDPEVAVKAEEVLQSQPVEDDPNFFQRLLNFVNPFTPAGAAEPNILDRRSVITGDFPQNQFPFRSMVDMAAANDLALNNMFSVPSQTNYGNTQSGFATNFPYSTNVQPVNTGITQSTAANQFEEPFIMSGGQKIYVSDVLGMQRAAEKGNVFEQPQGILTQAKDFITQQLPKTLKGGLDTLINFIPGMKFIRSLDKFDTLPYQDRKFIQSRMTGDVPGISVDPRTGLLKDAAGLNVRSLRGNYSEAVDDEYERYSKAIERAKEKYGVDFDGTQFTGANADIANKMNDRNINMFNFFKNQKAAKDQQIAELKAKMKKQVEAGATAAKGQAMHGGGEGGGGLSAAQKKAFAPRTDTFTGGKTVTLSDGRQYSSPR